MAIVTPVRRAAATARGRAVLAIALTAALAGSAAAAEGNGLESAIKATYLYKFEDYVEWPNGTFPSPSSPLVLCIIGQDPFGAVLDQAVSRQGAGGHSVTVRRLPSASGSMGCQIMYVAGSPAQSVAAALQAVHGAPVLTITDAARGGADTGIINFVVESNRVRFAIDDSAAAQNGLTISSDLLKLALSVKPRK